MESDNDTMEEAPTITDEIDVQTKMEAVKVKVTKSIQESQEVIDEEIDIDLKDPEVYKAPIKIQASSMSRKEGVVKKETSGTGREVSFSDGTEAGAGAEGSGIDWNSGELETVATLLQAGYRGMVVREEVKEQDELEIKAIALKGKQIEARLGIDLEDPSVIRSATLIQAGFRGARTRRDMKTKEPLQKVEIVIAGSEAGSESQSEYTYEYEDEEEESESLEDRPASPLTAIASNGRDELNIAGFRASALITTWLQRRRRLRPMTEAEKDVMASRIQAGYRGMLTREQHRLEKGEEAPGLISLTGTEVNRSPFHMAAQIAVLARRRRIRTQYPVNIR